MIKNKIKRELPPVGTVLQAKFKRIEYSAIIVEDKSYKSGKAIKYAGKKYPSMTAAANSITKISTNGWNFWKVVSKK